MRPSTTTGLLLATLLAACAPGTAPHPASPADQLSISGTVTGAVVAGVTIHAGGAVDRTTTTDAGGRFQLTGLARGQYTVAALAGEATTFTPASRRVTLLDRDAAGEDFVSASAGVIKGFVSGVDGASIPVTIAGPVTQVVACDATGFYRASGLPAGTYAVHPASPAAVFDPVSAVVTLAGGAVAQLDFGGSTSGGMTHGISGTVVGGASPGLALTLSGHHGGVTLSDAAGRYAFAGLSDGDYQVTAPPVSGLLYRSRTRTVTLAGADVTGLDFTSYVPATARWVYVMAQDPLAGTAVIYQYAVGAGGALTPLATPTVATDALGAMVADPSGHHLYAVTQAANTVRQYAIGDDGRLAPLANPAVASDAFPRHLATDPQGRWVWVHNQGGTLWRFDVGADGALSHQASASTAVSVGGGLALHPTGQHLYVLSGGAILQYDVAGDGGLTAMATPSVTLPPEDAGDSMARLALDPSGRFAFVTVSDTTRFRGWVVPYAVGPDGGLTYLGTQVYAPPFQLTSYGPVDLLVEPGGRFLYVAPDGTASQFPSPYLTQYTLGFDGLPALGVDRIAAGRVPASIATDPAGTTLYAASVCNDASRVASDGTVTWFTIEPSGALTAGGSVVAGLFAQSMVVVGR